MRLPRNIAVRPGYGSVRPRAVVSTAGARAANGSGIQPSIDIGCILSKAAGCLPVCITGNVPACIACAGPGILSCL
jgi:hypothetical protein